MMAAKSYLSESIQRIDTSEIRRVFDLAAKIKNPINLSIGQPDFLIPQAVKDSLVKAVQDNKNTYSQTQGILPLREALSQKYAKTNLKYDPNNIVVSTGVASILNLLFNVLFDPGDAILMTDPYFLIYDSMADYYQLNKKYIPESFSEDEINALKKSDDSIKAIIFSTPSNPTGKILSKKQVELLSGLAEAKGAVIISDEIYEAYDYDNQFFHTASINPERTLTLSGFSKSHAMTGLRVGYIAAPDSLKEIAQSIGILQQYSIVCAPQPSQWAALTALSTDISRELQLMKSRRDLVKQILGSAITYPNPDGAFYVYCDVPYDSNEFVRKAIERELLIIPGHIFSKVKNAVRISYAQSEEVILKGLGIFLELLES